MFKKETASGGGFVMGKFMIEEGIIIDDIELVLKGIAVLSGKQQPAAETIRKFITNEKNTKFYIDPKCNSKMQPDRDTVYLWLDSGYTDAYGNAIMISLLNHCGQYTGHYYGTMTNLVQSVRDYFKQNRKDINRNAGALKGKYEKKIAERSIQHIENENEFLLQLCNAADEGNMMSRFFNIEDFVAMEDEEPIAELPVESEEMPENVVDTQEEEMTMGLLLEKIDDMQAYIDELLAVIEKNSEDKEKIRALEAKNAELQKTFVQMRTFVATEAEGEEEQQASGGHALLGRNGRILVLGATELDVNTMAGIAKDYGFDKKDFDYETDYKKVVNYAGRISGSYKAIILGAVPHKVAALGDWSSLIVKCKQDNPEQITVDARNHAGELKVTKQSFRSALMEVCQGLKMVG